MKRKNVKKNNVNQQEAMMARYVITNSHILNFVSLSYGSYIILLTRMPNKGLKLNI